MLEIVLSVLLYLGVGCIVWLVIGYEVRGDGYIYWRKGSFKVYLLFWPILICKFIVKAFKELWDY